MRSSSRPPSRFVRVSAIFWLSLLAASTAFAQQPVPRATQPEPLVPMNESIDGLTKTVCPSVVQIVVSSYGPQREGPQGGASVVMGRQQATGSGFVIDPEGY